MAGSLDTQYSAQNPFFISAPNTLNTGKIEEGLSLGQKIKEAERQKMFLADMTALSGKKDLGSQDLSAFMLKYPEYQEKISKPFTLLGEREKTSKINNILSVLIPLRNGDIASAEKSVSQQIEAAINSNKLESVPGLETIQKALKESPEGAKFALSSALFSLDKDVAKHLDEQVIKQIETEIQQDQNRIQENKNIADNENKQQDLQLKAKELGLKASEIDVNRQKTALQAQQVENATIAQNERLKINKDKLNAQKVENAKMISAIDKQLKDLNFLLEVDPKTKQLKRGPELRSITGGIQGPTAEFTSSILPFGKNVRNKEVLSKFNTLKNGATLLQAQMIKGNANIKEFATAENSLINFDRNRSYEAVVQDLEDYKKMLIENKAALLKRKYDL